MDRGSRRGVESAKDEEGAEKVEKEKRTSAADLLAGVMGHDQGP